jgi:hypothetical protein
VPAFLGFKKLFAEYDKLINMNELKALLSGGYKCKKPAGADLLQCLSICKLSSYFSSMSFFVVEKSFTFIL